MDSSLFSEVPRREAASTRSTVATPPKETFLKHLLSSESSQSSSMFVIRCSRPSSRAPRRVTCIVPLQCPIRVASSPSLRSRSACQLMSSPWVRSESPRSKWLTSGGELKTTSVGAASVFSELAEEHTVLRFVQVREPVAAHLPARVRLCRASLTPRLAGRSSMPITSRSYATASRSSPCRRSSFCTRAS